MQDEGIIVSRVGVWKFLCSYKKTGSLSKLEGGGRRSKITDEIKQIIDQQMCGDDETTAYQMHKLLTAKGVNVSIAAILRCRKELGCWMYFWQIRIHQKYQAIDHFLFLLLLLSFFET